MIIIKPKIKAGNILPSNTRLRRHIWIAQFPVAELNFEIGTSATTGSPSIRSCQTGKFYVCTWTDLIKMAIEKGIEVEEEGR